MEGLAREEAFLVGPAQDQEVTSSEEGLALDSGLLETEGTLGEGERGEVEL